MILPPASAGDENLPLLKGPVAQPLGTTIHFLSADLNGDGWLDVVRQNVGAAVAHVGAGDGSCVLADAGQAKVVRGIGAGELTYALSFEAGSLTPPVRLELTDWDADGDLDAHLFRPASERLTILANDGP